MGGKKQSEGMLIYWEGHQMYHYEGGFEDNHMNGYGKMYEVKDTCQFQVSFTRQLIYDGEYNYGHKHGVGMLKQGPKVYKGQFVKGLKEGSGELVQLESDDSRKIKIRYIGDFKADKI